MRVGDAANRAKRDIMVRVPVVRHVVEQQDRTRLRQHAPALPALSARDRTLVQQLRTQGVVVTSLADLDVAGTAELEAGLRDLSHDLAAAPRDTAATVRPARERLLAHPEVWRWGLDERLLDIVENYIGLPVRYYGADVRCERGDGSLVGVRQWHRDVEDHRMLKILVWLVDVDHDGGPFEYVPRPSTEAASRSLGYVSGFVSDERMADVSRRTAWRQATGPVGTAVVADTVSVFHRAMPPVRRDRWSVTFTWTSRHPARTYPTEPFTDVQVRRLVAGLSRRQAGCLPPALQTAPV